MRPGRRRGDSRTGTVLVLAGIAGVLGATFVAGVWTGRHWPVLSRGAAPAAPGEAAGARRGPGDRPRPVEPLPALTFYHELTAPLTAPPPVPKPTRPGRPAEARREADRGADRESEAPASQVLPLPPPAAPAREPRYTVQVGAYNARLPAEALRSTLTAAGHDARVVEADTPDGVRFRVQVGVFPTREAAREAAVRLGAERSVRAFVTTR